MKKNYLSVLGALALAVSVNAQEVLPEKMVAITDPTLELTTLDDMNRTKNNKPMVKMANGSLVFSATAAATGEELYIYDGTSVKLIKDVTPGAEGSNPQWMTVVGDKVYFSATTSNEGAELWVTDGTTAGTKLVKDIYAGSDGSNLFGLTAFDGKLLFFAKDEESELDPVIDSQKAEEWLWISDGTDVGTKLVARTPTNKGGVDGLYGYIVPVAKKAFFIGYDLVNNETLWITDGTEAGTKVTININNKPSSAGNFQTGPAAIDWMYNVNDKLLIFRANTVKDRVGTATDLGSEIWLSDGTEAGTKWLGIDFAPGEENGEPRNTEFAFPIAYGDKVFFRAKDGVHGCEPCVTDLTPEGTKQYYDINHWNNDPSMDSWPQFPFIYQDYLFFQANGSYYMPGDETSYDSGFCLWRSNLQDECVYHKVWTGGMEIYPGNNSDNCTWMTEVGGRLFFRAQDKDSNPELWKLEGWNGTPQNIVDFEGSGSPHSLTAVGNSLFFITGSTHRLYKYAPEPLAGVENAEAIQAQLQVYPNPAKGQVSIKTDKEIERVNLVDLSGRMVSSQFGNQNSMDISNLSSGIYIVNVVCADGSQMNTKLTIE